MNASAASSAAREINWLHAAVARLADESQQALHAALSAAWRAGQLLLAEKKRVRRTMGAGAWLLWLEQNFDGKTRTAQNYMRLAQSVADVASLQGMSLRQAYIHLGISTAPKSGRESVPVQSLPAHVRFATRLVRALNADADFSRLAPERVASFRQDLRPLYEHLRRLFEPTANNSRSHVSNSA